MNKKINLESVKFVEREKISIYLTCQICLNIFDNPHRVTCGHTFCKKCLDKYRKTSTNCPACRNNYEHKYTGKDLIAQSIINDLQVYCINEGCPWKGRLYELENHCKNCILDPKIAPSFIKQEIKEKKKLLKEKNDIENNEENDLIEEIIGKNSSFNVNSSLKERIYIKAPGFVKDFYSQLEKKNEKKEENKDGSKENIIENISNEPEINDLYRKLIENENINEEDWNKNSNIIIQNNNNENKIFKIEKDDNKSINSKKDKKYYLDSIGSKNTITLKKIKSSESENEFCLFNNDLDEESIIKNLEEKSTISNNNLLKKKKRRGNK